MARYVGWKSDWTNGRLLACAVIVPNFACRTLEYDRKIKWTLTTTEMWDSLPLSRRPLPGKR